MVLDILTYKLSKRITKHYFELDEKQINQFKKDGLGDFLCTKEIKVLNFLAYFGITEEEYHDKYECVSITCADNEVYTFIDKKDPLYAVHQKILSKLLSSEAVYSDLELTEEDLKVLKNNNLVLKDFTNDSLHDIADSIYGKIERDVVITPNFPKVSELITVVYYEEPELAYQRGGLTSQYYADYDAGKFDYFVTNKSVMMDIYDNYTLEECRDNFKELLDSFIDGETIAIFNW